MKVYISKYALTEGIQEMEASSCEAVPGMIETKINGYTSYFHKEGRDWHLTRESASTKAEKMRKVKLASLKEQIAKLEKLTFN